MMTITQERAEEIIRVLQPMAQDEQIRALAIQLRQMLGEDSDAVKPGPSESVIPPPLEWDDA